jgi:hypothetical protein
MNKQQICSKNITEAGKMLDWKYAYSNGGIVDFKINGPRYSVGV